MTQIHKALNLEFEDHAVTLVAAHGYIMVNEWTLTKGRSVTVDECRALARLFDAAADMAETTKGVAFVPVTDEVLMPGFDPDEGLFDEAGLPNKENTP